MCAGSHYLQQHIESRPVKGCGLDHFGLGGLGHLGAQFAKALGYGVVVVNTRYTPIYLVSSYLNASNRSHPQSAQWQGRYRDSQDLGDVPRLDGRK
jgi:hypothetical protein